MALTTDTMVERELFAGLLTCPVDGPQQPFNQLPRITCCCFIALTVLDNFGAGSVSGKELFGNIKLPRESTIHNKLSGLCCNLPCLPQTRDL
jgi:hypothetical protein